MMSLINLNMIMLTALSSKEQILIMSYLSLEEITYMTSLLCVVSMKIIWELKDSNKEMSKKASIMIILMTMLAFSSSNLLMFVILVEMMIMVMSYFMLESSKSKEKTMALKFMILTNSSGFLPLMYCIMSSSLNCKNNFLEYFYWDSKIKSSLMCIMMILMMLTKLPIMFMHFWLSKAHVTAGGSCSMILASIMLKLGSTGMMKIMKIVYKIYKKNLNYAISMSSMSCLIMVFLMIRYFDMKNMIALSSILHMGFMISMILMTKIISINSSVLMKMSHGIISCIMFYLISIMYEMNKNRTSMLLKSLQSSEKMMTMILMIMFLMNMSFPPLANFMSEVTMMEMFMKTSLISMAFISIYFLMSMVLIMYFMTKLLYKKSEKKSKNLSILKPKMNSMFFLMVLAMFPMMMYFNSLKKKHYLVEMK